LYSAPAIWTDERGAVWIFTGTSSYVHALQLVTGKNGRSTLVSAWTARGGGTSPVVANGIVFVASDGALRALDARTGAVRWSGAIGSIHWESPIVVDGRVFIADESGRLTAFGL
jgi:outer membrane protein assembly factor BamB